MKYVKKYEYETLLKTKTQKVLIVNCEKPFDYIAVKLKL